MIKALFQHSRKGKVFKKDDVIDNLSPKQEQEAVELGFAYVEKKKKKISKKVEKVIIEDLSNESN